MDERLATRIIRESAQCFHPLVEFARLRRLMKDHSVIVRHDHVFVFPSESARARRVVKRVVCHHSMYFEN